MERASSDDGMMGPFSPSPLADGPSHKTDRSSAAHPNCYSIVIRFDFVYLLRY